jgi:hypothetical protein
VVVAFRDGRCRRPVPKRRDAAAVSRARPRSRRSRSRIT